MTNPITPSNGIARFIPGLALFRGLNPTLLRTGIIPRWMAFLGIALALILLLTIYLNSWAPTIFPLGVLLISVHILLANFRKPKNEPIPASQG